MFKELNHPTPEKPQHGNMLITVNRNQNIKNEPSLRN